MLPDEIRYAPVYAMQINRNQSNAVLLSRYAKRVVVRIIKNSLCDKGRCAKIQSHDLVPAPARNDILTMIIGKLEHSSRVRGIGGAIGLRDYFGLPQRSSESLSQEALRKIELQMEENLNQRMNVMEQRFMEQLQQQQEIQRALEEKLQSMTQHNMEYPLKL
ncbi:hypothetical protein LR48_Vigan10g236200 [Vigna angularis]|uniref:Uncharacterized protein n=1 Tax=Phaseolus angularis TaxID=3914 RepID=A0A0L9VN53_PHAAN|nr:hypothetical protein LR48_Vigan10g236200 [Vigna angularis]